MRLSERLNRLERAIGEEPPDAEPLTRRIILETLREFPPTLAVAERVLGELAPGASCCEALMADAAFLADIEARAAVGAALRRAAEEARGKRTGSEGYSTE
jgi:hypothetical protein